MNKTSKNILKHKICYYFEFRKVFKFSIVKFYNFKYNYVQDSISIKFIIPILINNLIIIQKVVLIPTVKVFKLHSQD